MHDDSAVLLVGSGEESRHILEDEQRDVERVAEADEPRPLPRRIDVQHTGEEHRLIRHDAGGMAVQTDEADDEIPREVLMYFEEVLVVRDRPDEIAHVVRLNRTRRCVTVLITSGPVTNM